MKVRVLEMVGSEYCDGYDDYRMIYNLGDITSWEEVNHEELEALYLWAREENRNCYDKKLIVLTEKQLDYKKTIAEYLEKAKKIREEITEREKKKKDKEESKKKRALESAVRKAEKEKEKKLKLYETLKEELGV